MDCEPRALQLLLQLPGRVARKARQGPGAFTAALAYHLWRRGPLFRMRRALALRAMHPAGADGGAARCPCVPGLVSGKLRLGQLQAVFNIVGIEICEGAPCFDGFAPIARGEKVAGLNVELQLTTEMRGELEGASGLELFILHIPEISPSVGKGEMRERESRIGLHGFG